MAKLVVAEGDDRALRADIDLLDIGAAAERLDRHDLEEMLDLLGQRAEAVDQLGGEGLDLGLLLEVGEPPVEAEAELQVGDVALRDHHRRADGDLRRPLGLVARGSPAFSDATASSSICW